MVKRSLADHVVEWAKRNQRFPELLNGDELLVLQGFQPASEREFSQLTRERIAKGQRRVAGQVEPMFETEDSDESFTLEQLIRVNQDAPLDDADLDGLRTLRVGESCVIVGGTGAESKFTRVR